MAALSSKDYEAQCNSLLGYCGPQEEMSTSEDSFRSVSIEIYTFLDPLCPECWAFEPILKKLQIEYSKYVRIRYFVSGQSLKQFCSPINKTTNVRKIARNWEKVALQTGMSCDGDIWLEDPITSTYKTSLAIKAAELQGRQAGIKFFRKIRESLFLNKMNIAKEENLILCAKLAGLDINEFKRDLNSKLAIKALKCDIKASREMEVEYTPTFVFFNNNVNDEGIKISGLYPYNIYEEILTTMLGYTPTKQEKIPLEQFLATYQFVATKEIAVVYDLTMEEAEKQLKKLVLKQKVEMVPVKYGTFWRYKC